MKTVINILMTVMFYCCGITIAQDQEKKFSTKPKTTVQITSCEENNSQLSILNQYAERSAIIFIISHSGKDEKKDIGNRRLHNAETFFNKGFVTNSNRPLESILIAEGRNVANKGYLDFYIRGELELRIFFDKNEDLRVPPCVFQFPEEKPCMTTFEKLFYPCKK